MRMTTQSPTLRSPRAPALVLAATLLALAPLAASAGGGGGNPAPAPALAPTTLRIPNGPLYAPVRVHRSQSLRLHFTNTGTNGSCTANVALVDQAGATFATASAIVQGRVNQVGNSTDEFVNASDFASSGPICFIGDCATPIPNLPPTGPNGRVSFRPSITLSGPAGVSAATACSGVTTSLEVIDPLTGRTDVLLPPTPVHPLASLLSALFGLAPPSPVFGFAGTVAGDVAQVSLANTNTNAAAGACPATLTFVDSTGATLATQSVSLAPGASAFLTQPGGSARGVLALRPVVTLLPPAPVLPISPFLPLRAVLAPPQPLPRRGEHGRSVRCGKREDARPRAALPDPAVPRLLALASGAESFRDA